jgi:hypothetical protein
MSPLRIAPLIVLLALASGCGPVSVERAEAMCLDDARLARGPTGEIALGVGNAGPRARLEVTVGSDFIRGRDPEAVFNACVARKSGRPPERPLAQQPGWKG